MNLRLILAICLFIYFQLASVSAQVGEAVISETAPFPGYLYRPDTTEQRPAILFLHGSEGGNGNYWLDPGKNNTGENGIIPRLAKFYASLGYVSYALCYFDCKHHQGYSSYPPDELKEIDLLHETYKALLWLKDSPYSKDQKLVLVGGSRGGEQALLLAAKLGEIQKLVDPNLILPDAVVALSPSYQTVGPFNLEQAKALKNNLPPPPIDTGAAWKIASQLIYPGQIINIENYPNPLFITFGDQDKLWGKTALPGKIHERLQNAGIDSYLQKFDESKDLQVEFDTFINTKAHAYSLEFEDQGHFPNRGSKAEVFMAYAMSWFIQMQTGATVP